MPRTVVLHIGSEKTGTTSIQRFLSDNRSVLLDDGVCVSDVPDGFNHLGLAAYAFEVGRPEYHDLHESLGVTADTVDAFREAVRAQLESEVQRWPLVLLSNEHLSSRARSPEEFGRLRDLLGGLDCDLRVLLYLRRPVDMIESRYSTILKVGHVDEEAFLDQSSGSIVDFLGVIERWRDVFGDAVQPAVFREEWKGSGDTLPRDFCARAGVAWSDLFVLPERLENRALGRGELALLRQLNLAEEADPSLGARPREAFTAYAEQHVRTPPYRIPGAKREWIWRTWLQWQAPLEGYLAPDDWAYLSQEPDTSEPEPDAHTREQEGALALASLVHALRGGDA